MEHSATSSLTTLPLRHDSSSLSQTSIITISEDEGVDIGLVARAFGLNPNSVRLNGYHVSSTGAGHVSSGLSWAELLDFFAQRGLPRGSETRDGDAIVVQGKLLRRSDSNKHLLKRKMELEFESSVKKTKRETRIECKSGKYVVKREPSKTKSVNKKRPKSEDGLEFFLKKIKIAESDTGTQESCTGMHLAQVSRLSRSFVSLNKI